ncbi:MAG: cytochrome c-type biogenesis protein CcmH [Formivibrio sp.]|nr:cytochrome c-type biogenesis protein CcmH [Formivibrio sp.]
MRALFIFIFSLWITTAIAGEAQSLAQDSQTEARMLAISEELRCLVCQNETLATSRAELAEDLRSEVRTLIKQGKSDAEIMDFLVTRYGDFVRYRPAMKPITWLLWFGPFLLLIGAIAGLIVYLRQRATLVASGALSEGDKARIKALLNQPEDKA